MSKVKILIFVGYYLPGYKGGGALRTIVNLVQHLGEEFDFWIVTRDRDLGDMHSYEGIKVDEWHIVDGAHVCYISPKNTTVKKISRLISNTPHDVLYLNSFFDPLLTIKPLLARYFFKATKAAVIVAPRGEFSSGALRFKRLKKIIYIAFTRIFSIYKGVCYQASSIYEARDIATVLRIPNKKITIAIDLPEKLYSTTTSSLLQSHNNLSKEGLRVIFLSRISPTKNLDYALNVLKGVSSNVQFDIYGPKEDIDYWTLCLSIIASMPANIAVNYCGSVIPADIKKTFSQYDLFFFPTHGENYGHVIAESIGVGTSVLTSDQTPWRNLDSIGIGWDLPLSNPNAFIDKIEEFAHFSPADRDQRRLMVGEKSLKLLLNQENIEANKMLFYSQVN